LEYAYVQHLIGPLQMHWTIPFTTDVSHSTFQAAHCWHVLSTICYQTLIHT